MLLADRAKTRKNGAGNESRTRDLNLGKVALYQLSYSRETKNYKVKMGAVNGHPNWTSRATAFSLSGRPR